MRRIGLFILCVLVAGAAACTSSSSPTSNLNTGMGSYDANYDSSARGGQSQQMAAEERLALDENPPVTIMLMSMETGDIYPGEDYYVYAVVDNLDNRDLEYVWSVADGEVREVPEAERGRLAALVETEYDYASAAAPASGEPAAEEAVPAEESEGVPAEGAEQAGTGEQPPPGAGLPGEAPAPGPAAPPEDYNPEERLGGGGGPGTAPPLPEGEPGTAPMEEVKAPEEIWTNEEINEFSMLQYRLDGGAEPPLTPEEEERLREFNDASQRYNEYMVQQGGVALMPYADIPASELRIVAGEDDEEDSSNVEALAEQLAASIAESTPDAGEEAPAEAVNVAEEAPGSGVTWVGRETESPAAGRALGLRSEYQVWRDESSEPRRRSLGGYGDPMEAEPLDVKASYEAHTFVTDEPYIVWTPRLPGQVKIYVKATYKDEKVTEPLEMAVTVRLRDPAIELSDGFPDIVREDESIYVALDASNIPAFYKGLFTLTFDASKLSFREAELGEFFDDVPSASLFYAQPDKLDGRVLLAIDSNTELGQLGGDGTVVYARFKAKQDIADQAETELALVLDTSARYILNREGENVLPLPTTYPVVRTATTMPPVLPEFTRDRTPGSKAGEQPSAEPQQPAAGGGGQQPPVEPGSRGGDQPADEFRGGGGGGSPVIGGSGGGAPVTQPESGGDQQPTGGDQQPTGGDQQPTGGDQQPTGGDQQPTGGDQPGDVPQTADPYASVSEAGEEEAAAEEQADGEKESAAEAADGEASEAADEAEEGDADTEEPAVPSGEEPPAEPSGNGSAGG